MTPLTRACRQARSEGPAVGLLVVLVVTDAGRALEPGQRPSETPLGGVFAALDIPPDWPAGPPALGGPQVIPAKPGHYLSQQVRGFSENHQSARLGRA